VKRAIICAFGVVLTGCVAPSQWLQRPDGQMVRCSAAGWGWIGAPLAEHSFNVCVEDYKKVGYVPVDPTPPTKVAGR
jgi:hypothetical protein